MVRRLALAGVAIASVLVVALVCAAPASARFGHHPHPGPPQPPPTSGSSGDPAQTTDRGCSLYATSSGFGLVCVTGHGTVKIETVRHILGKDDPPTCWDDLITPADLARKYQYTENPDAPYYLHSCITGLDLDSSLYYQPNLELSQRVIEIPKGAGDCPKPYRDAMTGTCVMTLTDRQRRVVSATDLADGQIPGITIATQPSTKIRTNETVAYVDTGTDGDHATSTPKYQVGGVTMWARMGGYRIFPYGPNGPSKACDGTADVHAADTPATKPNACWWTYPQSSGGQPGHVYMFRAEADWTVFYSDARGTHTLAAFQKYSDLPLPVDDIQTIVIN